MKEEMKTIALVPSDEKRFLINLYKDYGREFVETLYELTLFNDIKNVLENGVLHVAIFPAHYRWHNACSEEELITILLRTNLCRIFTKSEIFVTYKDGIWTANIYHLQHAVEDMMVRHIFTMTFSVKKTEKE